MIYIISYNLFNKLVGYYVLSYPVFAKFDHSLDSVLHILNSGEFGFGSSPVNCP